MRVRVLSGVVTGALVMALAACASPRTAPTGDVATADTAAAGAVAAAPGVCANVTRCRVVATADVDGDGRRDQVGLVVESEEHAVVRVRTAAGRLLRHGLDVIWYPRPEFHGAAPVDGHPGAELVVGTSMGAHTLFFTTLTARSGRLVRLSPPGGETEWMTDGAYSFHAGITRSVRDGRTVVVLHEAARQGPAARFSGQDRTYVWRGDGWRHVRTVPTRYTGERAVARISGWHVPGLPRLPDF
jgi:hypothetical protein